MRIVSFILVIALVIAIWWYYVKESDPASDNIFDRTAKQGEALKLIQNQNDVGNLAQLLHLTMARSPLAQLGTYGIPLATLINPIAAPTVGLYATKKLNDKDFTNLDSWKGLLAQTDKNIIAVNNYFNARYKPENKGNLYNWVKSEIQLPFSDASKMQTKVLDKMRALHLS